MSWWWSAWCGWQKVAGRLAGLLTIKDDYIDQLFVAFGLRRQGVGTALLQKAREHSPHGLRLYTFQKNGPAHAFYEKHGFKAMGFGHSPAPENEPDVEYQWNPWWSGAVRRGFVSVGHILEKGRGGW